MAKSLPVFTKPVDVFDFMQDKWSVTGFTKNHFFMAAFTAYALIFAILEIFQFEKHILYAPILILPTFFSGIMLGATLKQRNFEGLKPSISNKIADMSKIIFGLFLFIDYLSVLVFKNSLLFAEYRYYFFFNMIPLVSLAFVGHGIRSIQLSKFNDKIATYNKLKKHDLNYNTEVKASVFYQNVEFIYNPPVKVAPEKAPAFDAEKYKQDLLNAVNTNMEAPVENQKYLDDNIVSISSTSSSTPSKKEETEISLDTQRRIAELEQQRNSILNKQP